MNATDRFRAALKRERERQGLNRTRLASLMGVSRQRVGALEDGTKSPTLSTVQSAADALGVDPSLFAENGNGLRVRVTLRDDFPGFGAYRQGSALKGEAEVYLNLEAMLSTVANGPVEANEVADAAVDTVLHEVGHALQDVFGKALTEEEVERAVASFRQREYIPLSLEEVLTPTDLSSTDLDNLARDVLAQVRDMPHDQPMMVGMEAAFVLSLVRAARKGIGDDADALENGGGS